MPVSVSEAFWSPSSFHKFSNHEKTASTRYWNYCSGSKDAAFVGSGTASVK